MELLLVTRPLHLSLEPLSALCVFALKGVLGKKGLLLGGVLLRMFRLLVSLKITRDHASPPHIVVETNLTLVFVLPGVTLLDVSPQITFGGESLVTRECEILKVSGWRMVGAGVADAEVDTISVSPHVLSHSEALVAVWALVRARHLVYGLDVLTEVLLRAASFATGRTLKVSEAKTVLQPGHFQPSSL